MTQSFRKSWILFIPILALFLGGCGLSLAGDVTPPPNYREPFTEQPVDASKNFPLIPPNPAQGKTIYVDKCLPCHGDRGMGDGPQAQNLANPPAQLGNPDFVRSARPIDWYEMVTNGDIERFMPGFASLNDRQRWDVVAYAFSLSTTPEELAQGKDIYLLNCATCHGSSGQGDGEQAADLPIPPVSWSNQELLASISAVEVVEVINGGKEGHPSFSGQLNEAQQFSVANFLRTLSYTSPETPANNEAIQDPGSEQTSNEIQPGETTSQVDSILKNITVHGKVENATPGGAVPAGLKVVVTAYDGMTPAFNVSGDVDENGQYRVENVEFSPDYVYIAQVDANGLTFNSDILHGTDINEAEVDLPVQIYKTTTDLGVLRADRMHMFFDFTQPGVIQVITLYIISNPSGEVVVAPTDSDPVIRFTLPKGAMNLQFQDGELGGRYVKTEDGFGDRLGVAPGEGQHQILFAYTLPYDRKLALDVSSPLPVDAAIVLVPPSGISLKSNQLMDAGQRDVQGMAYQVYQTSGALLPGEAISLALSGRANTSGTASQHGEINSLLIGAGIFGVVLLGAGVWLFRQRDGQRNTEEEETEQVKTVDSSEAILDAIVALDDLHASGDLPEAAYQERRSELKARLAEALEREKGN